MLTHEERRIFERIADALERRNELMERAHVESARFMGTVTEHVQSTTEAAQRMHEAIGAMLDDEEPDPSGAPS